MKETGKYGEHELVTGLKEKDPAAFKYFYMHYRGALFTIIRQIIREPESANDVLQEVFITVWKNIDKYDPGKGRLFTWLLNITRNAAINMTRSKRYKNSLKTEDLGNSVYSLDKGEEQQLNINRIGLKKLVEQLKKEQREVLNLAYFEGLTQEEISKVLNIPLGTVKTRMRAALIEMRKLFNYIVQ